VISKFLQKIFKIISYNFFFIIYGKIQKPTESNINDRIRDIKYHNITKTILLTLENEGEIGILFNDRD